MIRDYWARENPFFNSFLNSDRHMLGFPFLDAKGTLVGMAPRLNLETTLVLDDAKTSWMGTIVQSRKKLGRNPFIVRQSPPGGVRCGAVQIIETLFSQESFQMW